MIVSNAAKTILRRVLVFEDRCDDLCLTRSLLDQTVFHAVSMKLIEMGGILFAARAMELREAQQSMQLDDQEMDDIVDEINTEKKVSQIDYWARITGERDVGRETVIAIYRESLSRIKKSSRIYGLKLPDREWCDLEQQSEESRMGIFLPEYRIQNTPQ